MERGWIGIWWCISLIYNGWWRAVSIKWKNDHQLVVTFVRQAIKIIVRRKHVSLPAPEEWSHDTSLNMTICVEEHDVFHPLEDDEQWSISTPMIKQKQLAWHRRLLLCVDAELYSICIWRKMLPFHVSPYEFWNVINNVLGQMKMTVASEQEIEWPHHRRGLPSSREKSHSGH